MSSCPITCGLSTSRYLGISSLWTSSTRLLSPRPKYSFSHSCIASRRSYSSWWYGPRIETEKVEESLKSSLARPPPPRIHIIGTGSIGCLIAHSLRSLSPKPPVTLFVHKRSIAEDFSRAGGIITLERHSLTTTHRGYELELSGSSVESLLPFSDSRTENEKKALLESQTEYIDHLIVTTKTFQAVTAIGPLKNRLTNRSTIAFIQSAPGVIDEVNHRIFPDPTNRPNYVIGIMTHSVSSPKEPYQPFYVTLHGTNGSLKLGAILPSDPAQIASPPIHTLPTTTQTLLRALLSLNDLSSTYVPPQEILSIQLERLAINCIINPLTVLFDCKNGQLLSNFNATQAIKLLLWEISQVILALPEMQALEASKTSIGEKSTASSPASIASPISVLSMPSLRFSVETLYANTIQVCRSTQHSTSAMLQDIRKGRKTEIDYMNGWIAKKGAELDVPCTMNYLLCALVKAKEKVFGANRGKEVPFEGVPGGNL